MSSFRPRRRTVWCAVAAVAFLSSGCGEEASAPAAATTNTGTSAGFGNTDLAWLQLMLPMTGNATELLRLVPEHSDLPAWKATAAKLLQDQDETLTRLRVVSDKAGVPDTDVHQGHRMPGMVTAADLIVLRRLHGDEFRKQAAALLVAYLDQSVVLADGEQQSGQDGDSRALAATIARDWPPQRKAVTQFR